LKEARRAHPNANKRISKWQPFWNKVNTACKYYYTIAKLIIFIGLNYVSSLAGSFHHINRKLLHWKLQGLDKPTCSSNVVGRGPC